MGHPEFPARSLSVSRHLQTEEFVNKEEKSSEEQVGVHPKVGSMPIEVDKVVPEYSGIAFLFGGISALEGTLLCVHTCLEEDAGEKNTQA
jgi:hypothetical protein